jgi:asparagine synthase (glutamine-hydrolysing)
MCGIAGIVSKNNSVSLKDAVFAMSQSIKHRGPDGEGFAFFSKEISVPAYSNETPSINKESKSFAYNPSISISELDKNYSFAFAHRRLSIIDLSEAGHQPMCDTSENYWLTFNGEIYNYIELREELKHKGHRFITQTDSEVLIEAYKAWGVDCLQRFNGMFAFSLFDKKNNQLFCARDRVGVKPFYYINTNQVSFEINEAQQIDYVLNANLETGEQSLFKGIHELKPAHYLVYNLSSHHLDIKQYYTLADTSLLQKNESEIIDLIEQKLVNAVKLRLRSDVEVGSCLSGGLDSSIIAGIIKHLEPTQHLKLFTAIFPTETFDESAYAKLVSESVNGNWKTVTPSADDFFRDIEKLNYYQDLPIWSTSTYSQHRVMQLASENGVKVVLDGQGADELFGGYAHHYISLWKEGFSFKKLNDAKQTIKHPYQLFFKQLLKETFDLKVDYSPYFSKETFIKSANQQSDKFSNTLNQQLKNDYNGRLKSFLKCEDRCSMAFGIESRVPFADDVDLVDLIFSVEGNKKIKNGISKYLLREATKKYIPSQIYNRKDKVGFETPIANWFAPHKTKVLDTITQQLHFINHSYLVSNYETLLRDKPAFLLRLYSLAIWKKVFQV